MKLDLIIPVYNNRKGLYRSLMSIGIESSNYVDVTVVDDCSDKVVYDDIIEYFAKFVPIRILTLEKNVGPGMARQYGLDHTRNDYVTFLDCGDYYVSPETIEFIYNIIQNDPISNMFCWGEYDYSKINISSDHNRMHGKVYKREFLNMHNIRFNPNESYLNEDIGFNMACRMILQQYQLDLDQSYIYKDNTPIIYWDNKDPSITRTNGNELYFNQQNAALAENGGYALRLAKQERVSDQVLAHQIYEIMCDMYFKYLSTIVARPEFEKAAFTGALRFYCQYFRPFAKYDPDDLRIMYYNTLVQYLADQNDYIRLKLTRLDFIEFIDTLELAATA